MTTNEALQAVEELKALVVDLMNGYGDRTKINQRVETIKGITQNVGTHRKATIYADPMVSMNQTRLIVQKLIQKDKVQLIDHAKFGKFRLR